MKDIFSPIFFTSLLSLLIFHNLNVYHAIFYPFIFSVFILGLVFWVLKKHGWSYLCAALVMVLLLPAFFQEQKHRFLVLAGLPMPGNQYVEIEGRVLEFPEIRKKESMVVVKCRSLEFQRRKFFWNITVRIRVNGNLGHIFRGDIIRFQARIFPHTFNRNFRPSPFENLMLYQGIHFGGYSKSVRLVQVIRKTGWVWKTIGRWRNRLRSCIENRLAGRNGILDRNGVFLEAILLGDRGKMDAKQRESLLRSGVFHLFAISGAHIGILAIISMLVLKLIGINIRSRIVLTLFLLLVFLSFSGFRLSAQRAVLMAVLILGARLFYYDIHIFAVISFSGLILLFKNPAAFLDPGFILTYVLTLSIVAGRKIFIRFFKSVPVYIRELISANLSAALISLPLSLFYFKRYSFAGFFAGMVLLPLTTIIIGLGVVMLLVSTFSTAIAGLVLGINLLPLRLFFRVVDFFSGPVNLTIFRSSPSIFWVVFIPVLFFLLGIAKRFRFQKALISFLLVFSLAMVMLRSGIYRPENLEVYYFDVGQGDSALAVFPDGRSLLIDGGGSHFSDFEVGKNLVLPFILDKNISVTWVAVSHYHPDHVRGIIEILDIIRPEEIWISSETFGEMYFRKLMGVLGQSVRVKKIHAPFVKKVGSCEIQFLFPAKFILAKHTHNNHSQVMRISDQWHSFLFTGDIEKPVEDLLAKTVCQKLRSQVLKVPHHGSRTSSSVEFFGCIKPEIAIFSCSRSNRFEFPHREVLDRLKAVGCRWLSTASRGGIKIESSPSGLLVDVSK
jgi:competence protein ComEC